MGQGSIEKQPRHILLHPETFKVLHLWAKEGQSSLILAFAEVTLAIHTVFWAGTGYVPPGPAFGHLRSAHESVFS